MFSPNTINNLLKLTFRNDGVWDGMKFYINEEIYDPDYLVVVEGVDRDINAAVLQNKSIFIALEPSSIKKYSQKFLDQFDVVVTVQSRIRHDNKLLTLPGHGWFINKTYAELDKIKNIKKNKLLSIVVSNKTETLGHRKRLEFCLKLKDVLGDAVDLYGRGFNSFEDKWDSLCSYKYSIAIENSSEDHYISEKFGDCVLAHTYPFYFGAANISDYYDIRSFTEIDIFDFDKSLDVITKIMSDDRHYDENLSYVLESKRRYMDRYTLFSVISNIIKSDHGVDNDPVEVCIQKEKTPIFDRLVEKVKSIY